MHNSRNNIMLAAPICYHFRNNALHEWAHWCYKSVVTASEIHKAYYSIIISVLIKEHKFRSTWPRTVHMHELCMHLLIMIMWLHLQWHGWWQSECLGLWSQSATEVESFVTWMIWGHKTGCWCHWLESLFFFPAWFLCEAKVSSSEINIATARRQHNNNNIGWNIIWTAS